MQQIIFEVENTKDASLLIEIAEKLGIKKYIFTDKKTSEKKQSLKIIEKGVDISNFGDPSEWQNQTRKDRSLKVSS